MILLADSEDPEQIARMQGLIWTFTVRVYPKTRFYMARPICQENGFVIKIMGFACFSFLSTFFVAIQFCD